MTAQTQAEQDYAEFIRWWQAKGYHDGQQVDFSDARDAFASGMRAARAATAAADKLPKVLAADGRWYAMHTRLPS